MLQGLFQLAMVTVVLVNGSTQAIHKHITNQNTNVLPLGHHFNNEVVDTKDMQSTYYVFQELTLQWKFNDDDTFDMVIHWDYYNWLGIGLGWGMDEVDMWIFNIVNGSVLVNDCYSYGWDAPATDKQQDLQVVSQQLTEKGFTIRIRRKSDTKDKEDQELRKGTQYSFCFAYSENLTMEMHDSDGCFDILWDAYMIESTSKRLNGNTKSNYNSHISYPENKQNLSYIDSQVSKHHKVQFDDMQSELTLSGGLKLQWKFNPDESFDIVIHWDHHTWLGIGLGSGMDDVDMWTFNIANNSVQVLDCYSEGEFEPSIDQQQDLQIISQELHKDGFVLRLRRKIDTLDSKDLILTRGTQYIFCYAYSNALTIEMHDFIDCFDIKWDSYQNSSITVSTERKHHEQSIHSHKQQHFIGTPIVEINDMESTLTITKDFELQWKFNSDDTFDMVVHWGKLTWFSIGLGPTMFNTDMIIFELINGKIILSDMFSTGHDFPKKDDSQDVQLLAYEVLANGYAVRFRRNLKTGDNKDMDLIRGDNYTFCYAFSDSQSIYNIKLGLEMHSFRDTFEIQFESQLHEIVKQKPTSIFDVSDLDTLYYAHAIAMFIAWGIIADFAIIIVRFFKHLKSYLLIHTLCFFSINMTSYVVFLLMIFNFHNLDELIIGFHHYVAIFMIGLLILQHAIGIVTKHFIQQNTKNNYQFIIKVRKIHVILGSLIYLIAKIELIIGLIAHQSTILLILGMSWIGLLLTIRIYLEYNKKKNKRITTKITPNIPVGLSEKQRSLMRMLENGVPTDQIIQTLPDCIWVLMNQNVYDLSDYQHPFGNFLITGVQGREISRFFYGAYQLEQTTIKPHNHSRSAYTQLQDYYIGELQTSLFMQIAAKNNGSNSWSILKKIQLSANINQFEFSKPGLQIRLQQSIKEIGQHFSVSFDEIGGKVRMYTKVLSMSEPCVDFRKQALEYFDKIMAGQEASVPKLVKVQSQSLPLIIKKYRFPKALSAELFETTKPVYIEGPFGRGLEIETNGQSVAFVGGTGLLPFIDLLDHLLMKSIYTVVKTKNPQKAKELFSQDEELSDNFQFTMMASFLNEEEFIGKQWIRRLYKINQDHNLKLFTMQIRYSDGKLDESIPSFHSRFNLDLVQKQLGDNQKQIYVCGPPVMNKSIIDILGKTEQHKTKIYIV